MAWRTNSPDRDTSAFVVLKDGLISHAKYVVARQRWMDGFTEVRDVQRWTTDSNEAEMYIIHGLSVSLNDLLGVLTSHRLHQSPVVARARRWADALKQVDMT